MVGLSAMMSATFTGSVMMMAISTPEAVPSVMLARIELTGRFRPTSALFTAIATLQGRDPVLVVPIVIRKIHKHNGLSQEVIAK